MLYQIIAVEPRPHYHLWLRFEDGLEGEVSVAHLVGRGLFKAWEDEAEFRKVCVDPESGTVVWPGGLDVVIVLRMVCSVRQSAQEASRTPGLTSFYRNV